MKKIFTLLFILSLSLVGCDSYLDRQPDDQLTSDTIWEKMGTTRQYLFNVYSFMPPEATLEDAAKLVQTWASDEASSAYSWTEAILWCRENWNGYSEILNSAYNSPYAGIHEASVFIENVDKCPELPAKDKKSWKAEARFMRAYYYYLIIQNFGGTFFNGSSSSDCLTDDIYTVDRTPWQTIVDFICDELDKAYEDLPEQHESRAMLGRANKGAALAVKARLLLYNARPLFNGQNGTGLYDEIRNNKGQQLFNTEYDPARWQLAADAAKAVIDYAEASGGKIKLTYAKDNEDNDPSVWDENDVIRGLKNLEEVFVRNSNPEEYIWTYHRSGLNWRRSSTPQNIVTEVSSWGGLSPTYNLVDAFAMADGVYPVKTEHWISDAYAKGLNVDETNENQVDPRAVARGYSEKGSTKMQNPLYIAADFNQELIPIREMDTPQRFVGREARFYRNIGWSGMQYLMGGKQINSPDEGVEIYTNGRHGYPAAHDANATGFLGLKLYDPKLNVYSEGWGSVTWPLFRLAAVYLDYIECLNEINPNHPDILKYWNMVRDRAAVPPIETVYYEIIGNKELQREYIRREKQVELCFESYRLVDCRTWMIAEKTNTGHVIGCKVKATTDAIDSEYWDRVEITKAENGYGEGMNLTPRKFTKKSYLFQFPTAELNKVPSLRNSNNYGW